MRQSKHLATRKRQRRARPSGRRWFLIAAGIVLALGALAGAMVLRGGALPGTGSPPATGDGRGIAAVATAGRGDPGLAALNGRWLRPDGGYVLEIRDAEAPGAIEVSYLNPRPISVARAEATRDGAAVKVFVELRAPNYPGSTYALTYDPARDQLAGAYFQAALGQTFDVVFTRIK